MISGYTDQSAPTAVQELNKIPNGLRSLESQTHASLSNAMLNRRVRKLERQVAQLQHSLDIVNQRLPTK